MSTRRHDGPNHQLRFDHGTQSFGAQDERFLKQLHRWNEQGIVDHWPPDQPGQWVGVPAMNAPLRSMADALDVQFGSRVEGILPKGEDYRLYGTEMDDVDCGHVVVAVPSEQAAELLREVDPVASALAEQAHSSPCWTLILAFDQPVALQEDWFCDTGIIGRASRNNSKPDRGPAECWVVQADKGWSQDHLEEHAVLVAQQLMGAFAQCVGGKLPRAVHHAVHRWRYALPEPVKQDFIWDRSSRLGVCGDWLRGPTVEDAWLSGRLLADAMMYDLQVHA